MEKSEKSIKFWWNIWPIDSCILDIFEGRVGKVLSSFEIRNLWYGRGNSYELIFDGNGWQISSIACKYKWISSWLIYNSESNDWFGKLFNWLKLKNECHCVNANLKYLWKYLIDDW